MSKNEIEMLEQMAKLLSLRASEAYLSVPNRNVAGGIVSAHDIDAIKSRLHDIVQASDRLTVIAQNIAARA